MNEQPLAALQAGLGEQASCAVVKTSGTPPGLEPAQRARDRHQLPLVHGRQLRLPAAADDAHDAVALAEASRRGPERLHLTGELQSRYVLRRPGRRG